jgi:predicted acyl esterase
MIENVFVPMKDGVRLAMQLWLPESSAKTPAPVVLEYIPYRKRDQYRAYGLFWGQTLASYGVGYARLDVRGSGDSEGTKTPPKRSPIWRLSPGATAR